MNQTSIICFVSQQAQVRNSSYQELKLGAQVCSRQEITGTMFGEPCLEIMFALAICNVLKIARQQVWPFCLESCWPFCLPVFVFSVEHFDELASSNLAPFLRGIPRLI